MKKLIFVWLMSAVSVLFFGCAGPKVMVNGIEYDALSEEEEKELCNLARLYLSGNVPNVISQQESGLIRRLDPICMIKYNGDRSGRAVIRWELHKRNIEVVFDGKLLDPTAKCWAQTEERSPEVIDFTKKGTLEKQLQQYAPQKKPRMKRSRRSRR